MINKELEDKLDELFPKERNPCTSILKRLLEINELDCSSDYRNEFDKKLSELIRVISKEAGRDRALVLVAIAQIELNKEK